MEPIICKYLWILLGSQEKLGNEEKEGDEKRQTDTSREREGEREGGSVGNKQKGGFTIEAGEFKESKKEIGNKKK